MDRISLFVWVTLPFCILRDVIHPPPGTHWDQKDRCSLALDRKWTSSLNNLCYVDLLWNRKLLLRYRYSLYHSKSGTDHSMAGAIPDCFVNIRFSFIWIQQTFSFCQQYLDPDCEMQEEVESIHGHWSSRKLLVSDNTWCKYKVTYYYTDSLIVPLSRSRSMSSVVVWIHVRWCRPIRLFVRITLPFCILRDVIHPATWYSLGPEGPVLVGIGQEVDIFPQQSMCYMLDLLWNGNCCCDTDTVCITVNPPPIIQMAGAIPDCLSIFDSIYPDTANIFISSTIPGSWLRMQEETEYSHGTGVVGNYWYPDNTCKIQLPITTQIVWVVVPLSRSRSMSSVVVNTCNADAGPDQVICLGNPAILHTQDDSSATWYSLGPRRTGVRWTKWTSSLNNLCAMLICCGTRKLLLRYRYSLYHSKSSSCFTLDNSYFLMFARMQLRFCWFTANIFFWMNNSWVSVSNAGERRRIYRTRCEWKLFIRQFPGTYTIHITILMRMDVPQSVTTTITVIRLWMWSGFMWMQFFSCSTASNANHRRSWSG